MVTVLPDAPNRSECTSSAILHNSKCAEHSRGEVGRAQEQPPSRTCSPGGYKDVYEQQNNARTPETESKGGRGSRGAVGQDEKLILF